MGLLSRIRSALTAAPAEPPSPPRLPATSEAALAAALAALPAHRRGWITMAEARALFSPMDAQYAFGETDDIGNANLSAFAAEPEHPAGLDFMPLEGRLYFTRKPGAIA
jgi:hypothetical protein